MKNPGEVRARTCGTKSPSWSEALRIIDSAKSQSQIFCGLFRGRLSRKLLFMRSACINPSRYQVSAKSALGAAACAQAGLWKGVDASAISSMQIVWWGQSRLAYPGVTLFFDWCRTSALKAWASALKASLNLQRYACAFWRSWASKWRRAWPF